MPSPTGSGNGVFVTKNRVYSVGGYQGQNTVYTAPIDSGGILGAWTTDTAFPVPIYFTQAFITRSRVYIVGGDNGSGVAYSSVYYAIINNDGTIGTWTLDTAFPATISWHSYIITSTMVYTIGGIVNGAQSLAIYSAPLNSDGSIGTWALVGSFPIAITQTQIIQTYNRVYSCGGTVSNAGIATVYTAPINNNGTLGPWVQGTNLPNNYWFSMAVNTKSRAWIISGNVGTLSTTSVITAPINTDGTLGVWAAGTSTPITIQIAQCIITSTRIYSIGKYWSANVYYAAFTGGSNDYVTNMFVPTINTSTQFTLPDFTTVDAVSGGLTTYIKF